MSVIGPLIGAAGSSASWVSGSARRSVRHPPARGRPPRCRRDRRLGIRDRPRRWRHRAGLGSGTFLTAGCPQRRRRGVLRVDGGCQRRLGRGRHPGVRRAGTWRMIWSSRGSSGRADWCWV